MTNFELTNDVSEDWELAQPDELLIRYHPFGQWEKWFKQRMREQDLRKAVFISVIALAFCGFGGIEFILRMIWFLAPASNFAAPSTAYLAQGVNALTIILTFLVSTVVLAVGFYSAQPTHILLNRHGVRFIWHTLLFRRRGHLIKWGQLSHISLQQPANNPGESELAFYSANDDPRAALRIKLNSIMEMDEKEEILAAIELWAPSVGRDAQVIQALQKPPEHSYTELWLQALTAPPKRERLKPLTQSAVLYDRHYIVISQLGVGGQGTAYLARDNNDGSEVVLKEFLLPVYVDMSVRRDALERFENEARMLQSLNHPQIVKMKNFFVEDHRCYLVLEHIDGASLRQLVHAEGKLAESQVHELAGQMCEILAYLHAQEPPVVHRDFTPDNLILSKNGTLKLIDFNVAQQQESTTTGTVVGKQAYLPPEQFRGQPCTQSDIYGFGATLYYLLTGQEPIPITCSRPQTLEPSVSLLMDAIVAKSTALELSGRFSTVEEITATLEGSADLETMALKLLLHHANADEVEKSGEYLADAGRDAGSVGIPTASGAPGELPGVASSTGTGESLRREDDPPLVRQPAAHCSIISADASTNGQQQEGHIVEGESCAKLELKAAVSRAVGERTFLPSAGAANRNSRIELSPKMRSELNLRRTLQQLPRPWMAGMQAVLGLLSMLGLFFIVSCGLFRNHPPCMLGSWFLLLPWALVLKDCLFRIHRVIEQVFDNPDTLPAKQIALWTLLPVLLLAIVAPVAGILFCGARLPLTMIGLGFWIYWQFQWPWKVGKFLSRAHGVDKSPNKIQKYALPMVLTALTGFYLPFTFLLFLPTECFPSVLYTWLIFFYLQFATLHYIVAQIRRIAMSQLKDKDPGLSIAEPSLLKRSRRALADARGLSKEIEHH
jgi:serine/threonine protein kinase